MARARTRTSIFVSYNHKDEAYLQRLRVHLKPLEDEGLIDCWADTRIGAGEQWKKEIQRALDTARIGVLLISADFLASDFIRSEELPRLLEAAEHRGLTLLPVILSRCRFKKHKILSAIQTVNHPDRPLIGLSPAEQEGVWAKLSEDIEHILEDVPVIAPAPASETVAEDWSDLPRSGLTSHQYHELAARLARRSAKIDYDLVQAVGSAFAYARERGGMIVEEGLAVRSDVQEAVGLRLSAGHWSPHLVLDTAARETVLEDALVLLWNEKLTKSLAELLTEVAGRAGPLLIVTYEMDEEALAQLVRATQRGPPCVAIKAPGFGDRRTAILEDASIVTGATLSENPALAASVWLIGWMMRESSAENLRPAFDTKLDEQITKMVGRAVKVIVRDEETLLLGASGARTAIHERSAHLREEAQVTSSEYDREKLEERASSFDIAIVRVGGSTVAEIPARVRRARYLIAAMNEWLGSGTIAAPCLD